MTHTRRPHPPAPDSEEVSAKAKALGSGEIEGTRLGRERAGDWVEMGGRTPLSSRLGLGSLEGQTTSKLKGKRGESAGGEQATDLGESRASKWTEESGPGSGVSPSLLSLRLELSEGGGGRSVPGVRRGE